MSRRTSELSVAIACFRRFSAIGRAFTRGASEHLQQPQQRQKLRQTVRDHKSMQGHCKKLPVWKLETALEPDGPPPYVLSAPILLGLALHGRRLRVLHLEPIGRATGAVGCESLRLKTMPFQPKSNGNLSDEA